MVPGTSLGCRLERIVLSAERIVARRAGIRSTIGLAAGLDPHESVCLAGAGGGGRAHAEAGAVDVAPVTPLLAEAGDGVAARVDDGLGGHAVLLKQRAEGLDVRLLVLALVPLRVGRLGELAGAEVPGVPAGDVGAEAADLLGRAGILVDGGELLGSRGWRSVLAARPVWPGDRGLTKVVVPAEPATMASIDVHGNIGQVKGLERICDTLTVA